MRWLAACVSGNMQRTKLGHRLASNALKGKLNQMSSDAFCLNVIYMLYELCVPFMVLGDDKINKIDPGYIPSASRVDLGDSEDMICDHRDMKEQMKFATQYGTISEFYFMLI